MLTEEEKAIKETINSLNKWRDLNEGLTDEELNQLHDNLVIVTKDVTETIKLRIQDKEAK
ncbi:hypothetical protein CN918_30675 [Priestia megaterium]|nr:hypothetical protein CN918_30675 [Priestia megaterium]